MFGPHHTFISRFCKTDRVTYSSFCKVLSWGCVTCMRESSVPHHGCLRSFQHHIAFCCYHLSCFINCQPLLISATLPIMCQVLIKLLYSNCMFFSCSVKSILNQYMSFCISYFAQFHSFYACFCIYIAYLGICA